MGDRQVRNRGTLVGSIVCAAQWGDIAPAAAVFAARMRVATADGSRDIALEAFVLGPGRTQLRADELALGLIVPRPPARTGSCYLKHGRVAHDRATIGVAAALTRSAGGECEHVQIAIGGLAAHPIARAGAVEDCVRGQVVDAALLRGVAQLAAQSLATQSDELASAEYRTQLLSIYLPRAVELAWQRSVEGST